MNQFRTRLALQSLDDRIVPDATPLINPMPSFNPNEAPLTTTLPATGNTTEGTTTLVYTEVSNDNLDDLKKQLADKKKELADNNTEIARLKGLIPGYDEAIKDAKAVVKEKSDNVKTAEAKRKQALSDYNDAVAKDGVNSANANKKREIANECLDDVVSARVDFGGAEDVLNEQQKKRNAIDEKIKDLKDKNSVLEKGIADLMPKIAAAEGMK